MRSMVGRITNRFAEREKVSHKCGAEPMAQCVTLVSCLLLDIPPPQKCLDFFCLKVRFGDFLRTGSNGTCDSGEFLSPAGQIDGHGLFQKVDKLEEKSTN